MVWGQVLNVPPERARSLPIAVQELLGYPLRHSGNMMDLFGDGPYRGGSSYAYTGAGKGGRSRLVDAVRAFFPFRCACDASEASPFVAQASLPPL